MGRRAVGGIVHLFRAEYQELDHVPIDICSRSILPHTCHWYRPKSLWYFLFCQGKRFSEDCDFSSTGNFCGRPTTLCGGARRCARTPLTIVCGFGRSGWHSSKIIWPGCAPTGKIVDKVVCLTSLPKVEMAQAPDITVFAGCHVREQGHVPLHI